MLYLLLESSDLLAKLESRPAIEVTQDKKAVEVAITGLVRLYESRSRPAENQSRPPGTHFLSNDANGRAYRG
jgi:hypothetical protein